MGVGLADREPPAEPATPARRGLRPGAPAVLGALALAVVVVAATLSLALPFWGDQALFVVYGRQLGEGAVLYRDLFDVKQPGIFYFFAVGGLLFGFTEVGIHLFELAYLLAFSAFAVVALRPYFTTRWGAPAVPVLSVAIYYLYAQVTDLTQIEILVAFPILAAWWLIDRADSGTRRLGSLAAAGVLAASVVLLKHLYLLVVLGFLVQALVRARRRGVPRAEMRRGLVAFGVGLLLPLLAVGGYFAAHGQLGRIWWAYFEYAPGATSLVPRDVGFLLTGARRFLIGHAPVLLLAALGCVHVVRHRVRRSADLAAGMVLWGALGLLGFSVQLWGDYKWLLFTVPLGILAVFGLEALAALARSVPSRARPTVPLAAGVLLLVSLVSFVFGARAPQAQTWLLASVPLGVGAGIAAQVLAHRPAARRNMVRVLLAALAVSAGLVAIAPASKLAALREHDFALTAEARDAFQRAWYPPYQAADEDLEVLQGRQGQPGSMYVLGHPALLLRADRPQVVPMLGWAYEVHDRKAWRELHGSLRAEMPRHIVIDGEAAPILGARHPALADFVESEYEVDFVGASGTWHVRRQAP